MGLGVGGKMMQLTMAQLSCTYFVFMYNGLLRGFSIFDLYAVDPASASAAHLLVVWQSLL
jgi:hypothetical protein